MGNNARYFVWANGLQNLGDQVVAAKTVLPALFQSADVPNFFTGLLVPIRESGSMLPQAALSPWVSTHRARKRLWIIGSVGQAASAAALGIGALLFDAWFLGLYSLLALAFLSLFHALCSLAGKDVQGRTIPKKQRGQVTGRATALGGAATLLVGILLAFLGELPQWALAVVILAGASTWAFAALVFGGVEEPVSEEEPRGIDKRWWSDTWTLFTGNKHFRDFVIVRSLLLVSALSTSFIVLLHPVSLAGFVLASGLAALLGGRVSGMLSDASSSRTMALGAGRASVLLLGLVAADYWAPEAVLVWVMPLGFFLVHLAHTAVRVARKTYIVNMAEGDERTRYVGAANTLMGVMLLGMGGVSAVISMAGPDVALLFLALVGFVGVWRARRLPEAIG